MWSKFKNTCGKKSFANCTFYESQIPEFSNLSDNDCVSLEETTTDLYLHIEDIKDQIDVSELNESSIPYTLVNGDVIVKNAIKKHSELILGLQEDIDNLQSGFNGNLDITSWDLDTQCLESECFDNITTIKDLFNSIVATLCELSPSGTGSSYIDNVTIQGTVLDFNGIGAAFSGFVDLGGIVSNAISEGDNIEITGSGTSIDPLVINSSLLLGNTDSPTASNGTNVVTAQSKQISAYDSDLVFVDINSGNNVTTVLRLSDRVNTALIDNNQNLQDVTDNGSSTTNNITISGTSYGQSGIDVNNADFDIIFSNDSSFKFSNNGTNPNSFILEKSNIDTDVNLQVPNTPLERVIPISVNGQFADTAGNIALSVLQDLDSVLLQGNTSDEDIILGGTIFSQRSVSANNTSFDIAFESNNSSYKFDNADNVSHNLTFKKTNLSQSVVLQAPNKNGENIIPLTVNGNTPTTDGNIALDLSGFVPYIGATSDVNLGINELELGNRLFIRDSVGTPTQGLEILVSENNNGNYIIRLNANNETNPGLSIGESGNYPISLYSNNGDKLLFLRDTGLSAPDLTASQINGTGAKSLITKEYADANYAGGGSFEGYAETGTQNGGDLVATVGETTHPSLIANIETSSPDEQVQINTLNSFIRLRQNEFLANLDSFTFRDRTSGQPATFTFTNITAPRSLELPNKDGVLATLDDVTDTSLQLASTSTSSFNAVVGHVGGMNDVDSATDVTVTIQAFATEAIPVGSVLTYQQINTGMLTIAYSGAASGDIKQTYKQGDVLSIWHKSLNNWVVLNPPHRLDSQAEGEPTGFTPIKNIGTISQADYDAGTPVAGTTYLIV